MSHATCLLALPEFEVVDVWEFADEAIVHIVRPRDEAACTRCGVIARHRVHDRVVHRVRDLPAAGRAVVLLWRKRVLVCVEGCGTFRERSRAILPRACLTVRARAEAVRLVSGENRSVAAVAATFGVAWDTVMRAVRDHATQVLEHHDGQQVVAFGLDETVMNPSRSHTRRRYVTVFVDLDRHRVIDVVEGRHAAAVTSWLQTRAPSWRAQVATVALDPHAGYRTAVTDRHVGFDNAQLVADCFHVVKLANAVIDDVRRRVQQETTGHRGHTHDPLYRIRRALLAGIERLDDDAITRIRAALATGDPYDEVGCAWIGKELVRGVFATTDPDVAARRLVAFYEWVADVEVPELVRLATTLSRWQDEILAYTTPAGSPRPGSKRSTWTSKTSSAWPAGSPTSTTTAPGSSHASATHGRLPPPPDSEAPTPSPWQRDPPSSRRAAFVYGRSHRLPGGGIATGDIPAVIVLLRSSGTSVH